jgi:hypothetical protein
MHILGRVLLFINWWRNIVLLFLLSQFVLLTHIDNGLRVTCLT